MEIIDSHCHVYPKISYLLKENSPKLPSLLVPLIATIEQLEQKLGPHSEALYEQLTPVLTKIHDIISRFNHKIEYEALNVLTDKLYTMGSLGTLFCRDYDDLKNQMNIYGVNSSIVIAHPPLISNDFVLELAAKDTRIIPIINIPNAIEDLEGTVKRFMARGAKGIKIHAAASGLSPAHDHHKKLIQIASDLNLPVIIHTGALEIYPIYKKPDYGHAEAFTELIELTSSPVILAHMNIHYPETAIEMCTIYPHVYTDTSWQDGHNILRAIQKCGAQKVMFGTDWPIVGNNIDVSLSRIMQLQKSGDLTDDQLRLVLGQNAKKIFNITS